MELVLDVLSWICLLVGSVVVLVGTLGLLRLPDVYCRMHGTGMTDTMGAFLILLGMAFQTHLDLVTIKLALVFIFLMITSPTATHALAQAAMTSSVLPRTDADLEGDADQVGLTDVASQGDSNGD